MLVPRLYIKTTTPGVRFTAPGMAMAIAFPIIGKIYNDNGQDCRISSGNDGGHMPHSKHYINEALDFSIKMIEPAIKKKIIAEIKAALPGYDVLHENVGTENEHLHVEYDPTVK